MRGEQPLLRTGGMNVYMVRHPRSSYVVNPVLSLEVATPENKTIILTLLSVCEKIRLKSFFSTVGCSPPYMRLAQHLTVLRA